MNDLKQRLVPVLEGINESTNSFKNMVNRLRNLASLNEQEIEAKQIIRIIAEDEDDY